MPDDLVQLGGIILRGIAYLNDDDNAFMALYRLLTGDEERRNITLEKLKAYGGQYRLRFIIKKAARIEYKELVRLNGLIVEQVLAAA